jgi:hypothetical protein
MPKVFRVLALLALLLFSFPAGQAGAGLKTAWTASCLHSSPVNAGVVTYAEGNPVIDFCGGGRGPIAQGDQIRVADCLQTGPDGYLRLSMSDRVDEIDAGPTVIDLPAGTDLCLEDLTVDPADPPRRDALIKLTGGTFKWWAPGWQANGDLSVQAGTTLLGGQASQVLVSHDLDANRVSIHVLQGQLDIASMETGESQALTSNQSLVVEQGLIGQVQPMSQQEWDGVLQAYGIIDGSSPDAGAQAALEIGPSAPAAVGTAEGSGQATAMPQIAATSVAAAADLAPSSGQEQPPSFSGLPIILLGAVLALVAVAALLLFLVVRNRS